MRARVISPIFLALLVGVVALPAAACERELAEQSPHSTVTAFTPEHSAATKSTPGWRLAACKPNGATCTADADCCSGACKPIAEGRACVPNK
jgi:hypothetical protein